MTGLTDHPPSDEPESPAESPSLPVSSVFRAILGDSSLPMAATEGEKHLVRYANAAFCRLVARGDEQVLGHPLHAILEVTGLGDTVALLDRVYSAGGAASVAVFHEGGVQAAVHATYAAWRVPAEHDRPAGLLLQVMDTSDRVRAADELSEVNRRLLQAGLDAESEWAWGVGNRSRSGSKDRIGRRDRHIAALTGSRHIVCVRGQRRYDEGDVGVTLGVGGGCVDHRAVEPELTVSPGWNPAPVTVSDAPGAPCGAENNSAALPCLMVNAAVAVKPLAAPLASMPY